MRPDFAGAALAALFAAPATAHIPERCHDLVAERIAAQKAAIEGFEALSEFVFARMPMFMIEQAVADASSVLSAKSLAELRLVKCIVAEQHRKWPASRIVPWSFR